jgi:hypothetical protein
MDLTTYHYECNNLKVALYHAANGFFVFPCHGKQPCPGVRWRSESTTDEKEVLKLWQRFPGAAPAIDLARSGLLVPDCDKDGDNIGWIWLIARSPEPLESVPGSRTPSGGRHPFFRNCDPPLGCGRGSLPPKSVCNIDVKGAGGYVLAPGADTTAWGGGIYEPIGDFGNIPPCPEWLAQVLRGREVRPPAGNGGGSGNGVEHAPATSELSSDPRKLAYGETALIDIVRELSAIRREEHRWSDELWKQACKTGELIAGGCLAWGTAYSAFEEVVRGVWGCPPNDKALGPQGTIARGFRQGMGNRARGPAEGEESGVVIRLPGMMDFGRKSEDGKADSAPEAPLVEHKTYVIVGAANVPLRPWVYGKLLIRKNVTMTVAPGGMGKSSQVIVEALAQASGKPLLGIAPKHPLVVAYWNLEDPYDELVHRFEAAILHYGITQEDIAGRLFVNSGRDTPLIVAEMTRGEARILRPVINALIAENKAKGIDVLAIDPYVSCNRVPENDNSMQNAIINEWGVVADRSNCAVHLVDHTRKMGGSEFEVTAESQRGAVAKKDASRITRVLNQMTKEDGDNFGVDYRLFFRTDKGKHNMSPPEKAEWHKLVSVSLGNDPAAVTVNGVRCAEDDEVGVVTRWQPPDAFAGLTSHDWDKVAAVVRRGEWRESARSPNWVGLAIAEALGLNADLPADKGRVKRLLKGYLKAGSLVVVEKMDANRHARQYIEVAKEQQ